MMEANTFDGESNVEQKEERAASADKNEPRMRDPTVTSLADIFSKASKSLTTVDTESPKQLVKPIKSAYKARDSNDDDGEGGDYTDMIGEPIQVKPQKSEINLAEVVENSSPLDGGDSRFRSPEVQDIDPEAETKAVADMDARAQIMQEMERKNLHGQVVSDPAHFPCTSSNNNDEIDDGVSDTIECISDGDGEKGVNVAESRSDDLIIRKQLSGDLNKKRRSSFFENERPETTSPANGCKSKSNLQMATGGENPYWTNDLRNENRLNIRDYSDKITSVCAEAEFDRKSPVTAMAKYAPTECDENYTFPMEEAHREFKMKTDIIGIGVNVTGLEGSAEELFYAEEAVPKGSKEGKKIRGTASETLNEFQNIDNFDSLENKLEKIDEEVEEVPYEINAFRRLEAQNKFLDSIGDKLEMSGNASVYMQLPETNENHEMKVCYSAINMNANAVKSLEILDESVETEDRKLAGKMVEEFGKIGEENTEKKKKKSDKTGAKKKVDCTNSDIAIVTDRESPCGSKILTAVMDGTTYGNFEQFENIAKTDSSVTVLSKSSDTLYDHGSDEMNNKGTFSCDKLKGDKNFLWENIPGINLEYSASSTDTEACSYQGDISQHVIKSRGEDVEIEKAAYANDEVFEKEMPIEEMAIGKQDAIIENTDEELDGVEKLSGANLTQKVAVNEMGDTTKIPVDEPETVTYDKVYIMNSDGKFVCEYEHDEHALTNTASDKSSDGSVNKDINMETIEKCGTDKGMDEEKAINVCKGVANDEENGNLVTSMDNEDGPEFETLPPEHDINPDQANRSTDGEAIEEPEKYLAGTLGKAGKMDKVDSGEIVIDDQKMSYTDVEQFDAAKNVKGDPFRKLDNLESKEEPVVSIEKGKSGTGLGNLGISGHGKNVDSEMSPKSVQICKEMENGKFVPTAAPDSNMVASVSGRKRTKKGESLPKLDEEKAGVSGINQGRQFLGLRRGSNKIQPLREEPVFRDERNQLQVVSKGGKKRAVKSHGHIEGIELDTDESSATSEKIESISNISDHGTDVDHPRFVRARISPMSGSAVAVQRSRPSVIQFLRSLPSEIATFARNCWNGIRNGILRGTASNSDQRRESLMDMWRRRRSVREK